MSKSGLRAQRSGRRVTLAVVGVIIAGGAAAVAKWPHAWWWLVVVALAAAAVAPPALAALSQAAQRGQEIGRVARAGLQGTTGAGGRKLPTASTAGLEARVHQTVLQIPYIRRDEEDGICAYLHDRRPVLLIGSSMVGKTKMAAHIIANEFAAWPVAIPDSKTALADLDAKDMVLRDSVIWLDDIDRLIGLGGISDGALRRLADAGNIIIGTIRARAYEQFRQSDEFRPPEWDVLSIFMHIIVNRDLTDMELERLAHAVDDPNIRDRIRTVGLGEYVGAAMQVAEALKLGAAGTNPLGYALVLAAADWRRCGMTRQVSSSLLAALAQPYLDHQDQNLLANQDAFTAGLAWATRDINPNVALLKHAGTDSYAIYDYALDLISAQGTSIPESNWAVIVASADIPELLSVGYAASVTYHQSKIAARAWRKAAESGHADLAPRAAYSLGRLLRDDGDVPGAMAAFQQAIDSGHADMAPKAMFSLGLVLKERRDVPGAIVAYQRAIDSGHANWAPKAAYNLGLLLRSQGDAPRAMAAFQQAIESGHADIAPKAMFSLGKLLRSQGDAPGAMAAFQQAVDSGHANWAPKAAYNLGLLQNQRGAPGVTLSRSSPWSGLRGFARVHSPAGMQPP